MSVSINACLNMLNFDDLGSVRVLLQNGTVRITPGGCRVVSFSDYQGEVSLDSLVSRIYAAAQKRCSEKNLETDERVMGKKIIESLEQYYSSSEDKIYKCGLVTRIILWIRKFFHLSYFQRDIQKENAPFYKARLYFRTYSYEQFQKFEKEYKKAFPKYKGETALFERKNHSTYCVQEEAIERLDKALNRQNISWND